LVGAAHVPSPDVRSGLRPPLTPRRRRFAILAALAGEAGSRDVGSPDPAHEPARIGGADPGRGFVMPL